MKIEYRSLDQIHPYDNNPRRIPDAAVDALAESIRRYGIRQPIVIDQHGVIAAGHARRLAARQLGLSRFPCHVADDLEAQKLREYRLADNRTGELTSWDVEALKLEAEDIEELPAGFGEDEWSELKGWGGDPAGAGAVGPPARMDPPTTVIISFEVPKAHADAITRRCEQVIEGYT